MVAACSMMQLGQPAPQSKSNSASTPVIEHLPVALAVGKLYQAQVNELNALRSHFADLTKPNITLSGLAAVTPYVLNATRVLVITPSIIISWQIHRDMSSVTPGETFYEKTGLCSPADVHHLQELGLLVNKPLGNDAANITATFCKHNLVVANAHKFGATANVNLGELPSGDLFDLVIVDEAHDYPARAWNRIIDHFATSTCVFLTATPHHGGGNIVGADMAEQQARFTAYQLTRDDPVQAGHLRPLAFVEVGATNDSDQQRIGAIVTCMHTILARHDTEDPSIVHQAMILCNLVHEVDTIVKTINTMFPVAAGPLPLAVAYHGKSGKLGFDAFRQLRTQVLGRVRQSHRRLRCRTEELIFGIRRRSQTDDCEEKIAHLNDVTVNLVCNLRN
ncbi:hypothetical protein HKX48_005941 [Thoreauomyces humboldtii]|nr:hypothetical protein HKX48_005941 [Thoreauomyces humboldtii]